MSPLPKTGRVPEPDPATESGEIPSRETIVASEPAEGLAEGMKSVQNNAEGLDQPDRTTVVDHLELAISAADAIGMSTSELVGLLFYYAHNIAQEAREEALAALTVP